MSTKDGPYYAARIDDGTMNDVPTASVKYNKAKRWNVAFLVYGMHHEEGMYDHDDGNRYYLHRITWEEFDMLDAFGVECTRAFPAVFPMDDDL